MMLKRFPATVLPGQDCLHMSLDSMLLELPKCLLSLYGMPYLSCPYSKTIGIVARFLRNNALRFIFDRYRRSTIVLDAHLRHQRT